MYLDKQWLFTPAWRQKTAQRMRQARRMQPLPSRDDGAWSFEPGPVATLVTWRRTGFQTGAQLESRRGPFVEVGGPTPLWTQHLDRPYTPTWGDEADMRQLPKPLIVTNLIPEEEVIVLGSAVGDAFIQADATRLPFGDGSLGALFSRGLSIMQPPDDDKCLRERTFSRVLRLGFFEEAWRTLEPGGVLYLAGATRIDLALLKLIGFELAMFHSSPDASRYRAVFREVVFLKPLGLT